MAKYILLHAAVNNIAKGLATAHPGQYSNPDSATAAARQQLVQALYDGVLVAEGDSKELVAPDSPEPGRGISGARQTMTTRPHLRAASRRRGAVRPTCKPR